MKCVNWRFVGSYAPIEHIGLEAYLSCLTTGRRPLTEDGNLIWVLNFCVFSHCWVFERANGRTDGIHTQSFEWHHSIVRTEKRIKMEVRKDIGFRIDQNSKKIKPCIILIFPPKKARFALFGIFEFLTILDLTHNIRIPVVRFSVPTII